MKIKWKNCNPRRIYRNLKRIGIEACMALIIWTGITFFCLCFIAYWFVPFRPLNLRDFRLLHRDPMKVYTMHEKVDIGHHDEYSGPAQGEDELYDIINAQTL